MQHIKLMRHFFYRCFTAFSVPLPATPGVAEAGAEAVQRQAQWQVQQQVSNLYRRMMRRAFDYCATS